MGRNEYRKHAEAIIRDRINKSRTPWDIKHVFSFFLNHAEHGFVGYSAELMLNNTLPDYSSGESFFTVFGVFFPAATGTVEFYRMRLMGGIHANIES